jgi:hypothetical protein
MRLMDDRYGRDLRRYNLALRLIRHEARTHTICDWTGLTEQRVGSIRRGEFSSKPAAAPPRHRGPSPRLVVRFLRATRLGVEAATAAGLCRTLGVLPSHRLANAVRTLPTLGRGERLCEAFERYREFIPRSNMTLEGLVLLLTALAQGDELYLGNCGNCGGVIVVDRLSLTRRICNYCKQAMPSEREGGGAPTGVGEPAELPPGRQGQLF